MKLTFPNPCIQCSIEQGLIKDGTLQVNYVEVEFRNDNLYKLECPSGHINITRLQNQKFELLFDLGAMTLLDGYTGEAVTTMAAALERFYEFYVKVLCIKHEIPETEFNQTWKIVGKQSERQLGAFLFLHLLENKRSVNFFKKIKVGEKELQNFRNEVVHNGYVPSYEEVIEYGEAVMAFIFRISKELKNENREFIEQAIYRSILDETEMNIGFTANTIIGFLLQDELILKGENAEAYTFKEALRKLNLVRERGYITLASPNA